MAASKKPRHEIAQQLLSELLIQHLMQTAKLQALLGVSRDFEPRVQALWDKANKAD